MLFSCKLKVGYWLFFLSCPLLNRVRVSSLPFFLCSHHILLSNAVVDMLNGLCMDEVGVLIDIKYTCEWGLLWLGGWMDGRLGGHLVAMTKVPSILHLGSMTCPPVLKGNLVYVVAY